MSPQFPRKIRFAWVRHASREDVAGIVRRKEPRVREYLEACDEVWLLIIFEFLAGSIHIAVPMSPPDFSISTGFAKVFCLEAAGMSLVPIPISHA